MRNNQKGSSVATVLIVVIIIGVIGAIGWLVYVRQKSDANKNDIIEVSRQEITNETKTYKSKLYPSLNFTLPDGWEVNEPRTYDESIWGAGSADSEIKINKDATTLSLKFSTLRATGFEGYTCHKYNDLVKVKDTYRFLNKEGGVSYRAGISYSDKDWSRASTGEYSSIEDSEPNYCVSFPFIATHRSKLSKHEYPESPFNGVSTDVNDVLAWVLADIEGVISKEVLADTDTIISSFSSSVDW